MHDGHHVRALARTPEKAAALARLGAEPRLGDLLDAGTAAHLREAVAGCQAIVHAATAIPRDLAAPGAWDANTRLRTDGIRLLLDASLAAGVERLSPAEHRAGLSRRREAVARREHTARHVPGQGRQLRTGHHHGIPGALRAPRPASLVHPARRHLRGPGTAQDDLIAQVKAGVLRSAPAGSVFNVVDEPLRYGTYLDRLAELVGAPPLRREPTLPQPPSCRATNQAARTELGWRPEHGIWPAPGGGSQPARTGDAGDVDADRIHPRRATGRG